jgi:hypothetical protein
LFRRHDRTSYCGARRSPAAVASWLSRGWLLFFGDMTTCGCVCVRVLNMLRSAHGNPSTSAAPHAPRPRHCPMRWIYCFTDRHKHPDLACRQHNFGMASLGRHEPDTWQRHASACAMRIPRTAASVCPSLVPEQLPSIYAGIRENPGITAPR